VLFDKLDWQHLFTPSGLLHESAFEMYGLCSTEKGCLTFIVHKNMLPNWCNLLKQCCMWAFCVIDFLCLDCGEWKCSLSLLCHLMHFLLASQLWLLKRLSTVCDRAFSSAAPHIWNNLPSDVTSEPSLSSFRRQLKTYLFQFSLTLNSGPCGYLYLGHYKKSVM